MRFGSVCSGCGCMDLGLESAGMECAWQIEIDDRCNDVLTAHWPDVPRHRDLKEVHPEQLGPVDVIAGGTPCQDLSAAGKREGLDGERSGLFYNFARLADSQPSALVLWENVDGALSSNKGMDFATILAGLCGTRFEPPDGGWKRAGFCVGPKRWLVWRVLDSRYFGVAQRRNRVFVVGGTRARPGPEILFEPASMPGHPPARGGKGAVTSTLFGGGAGERGYRIGAEEAAGGQIVARALNAKGGSGRSDFESETFVVASTLRGEGHDASEDGTGRQNLVVASTIKPYRGTIDTAGNNESGPSNAIIAGSGVRRLLPVEYELLQGLPRDWTRYGVNAKGQTYELKDGPRYRMVGNGVTRNVAEWIGRRIMATGGLNG